MKRLVIGSVDRDITCLAMPSELDDDHVAAICRVLIDHKVHFVVIGGIAARMHGTGHATVDIDICPSRTEDNLVRLAAALRELGARLRIENDPEGVPFDLHPDALRQVKMMTLITTKGPLDLCFEPAGYSDGYDALSPRAAKVALFAVEVPIASLADIVASKRAAGRPKDIVALPALEARLRQD